MEKYGKLWENSERKTERKKKLKAKKKRAKTKKTKNEQKVTAARLEPTSTDTRVRQTDR